MDDLSQKAGPESQDFGCSVPGTPIFSLSVTCVSNHLGRGVNRVGLLDSIGSAR